MYGVTCTTHRLNTADPVSEEFQILFQTLNVVSEDLEGTVPNRSIWRSPFMSMGIGWDWAEDEAEMGVRSDRGSKRLIEMEEMNDIRDAPKPPCGSPT